MNRNYYKQGQSSKVPYILVVVILALLYIMNGMNEDRKDADHMFKVAIEEFKSPSCDSLKNEHNKEVDSLKEVIDWYKNQYELKKNKQSKFDKKPKPTNDLPEITDSI